uniref:Membrane protein n=1 Tax=endosymbiont of Ridgeia piscesae TaxID=54398 RepID=D2CL21_9GAMM|nr:membrane protein [endosymbiont of Ridgeia piscesae]
MVEATHSHKWAYRMLFLALVGLIIFLRLIPMQTTPSNWAMPNLLMCLCFAWVLRRPDYTPILLITAVMITADFLFMRPPGLMAALIVLGSEFLRARNHFMRELPFSLEWGMVAGVITAIMVANRMILILVMSPRPPLGLSLFLLVATLAAYPLVVIFTRYALGIRKISPGEVDALGHRI